MMMDFSVKHQIKLLYISMGLIVIQAYIEEAYGGGYGLWSHIQCIGTVFKKI